MLDFILCQCCVSELPPDEPPQVKQAVEVFLTGINFILLYCSDSIIELSTAKSTDYVDLDLCVSTPYLLSSLM